MAFWDFLKRKSASAPEMAPDAKPSEDSPEDSAKKRRLPTPPARDLPINTVTGWNDVARTTDAITALENGSFSQAAMLWDAMMRDDRISGVVNQRIKTLLGKPMAFESNEDEEDSGDEDVDPEAEPSPELKAAQDVADWCEDNWDVIVPEPAQVDLMKWALGLGVAVGDLSWQTGDEWRPTLRVYHPRHLSWRWDTRSYWITTLDGYEEIKPGDGRWVLFTPNGTQRGWMGGLIRPLAIPFLIRQFTYRDWARFSEVYGSPIRKGHVPPSASQQEKQRFARELTALSNEPTILLARSGAAGVEGFDVTLLEATATNWQAFDKLIEKAEDSIAVAVLGETQTSSSKADGIGSGASDVHEKVRDDLLKADAKVLGQFIQEQILAPAVAYNFGDPELAPLPTWEIDPPEDLGQKATNLKMLGDGIASLKTAGIPVNAKKIAEEFQIPMLSDEEHAALIEKESQQAADKAKKLAEAVPPAPAVPGKSGPPSTGKVAAGALIELTDKPAGAVRGQLYTDDVVDLAVAEGARALQPDLHTLLSIIQSVNTQSPDPWEELRAKLQQAYKGMRPELLADLMHKAMVLADLNGQAAVKEDTHGRQG